MTTHSWKAVVVGGSAGSLEAISAFFPELPADFPLPVIVVIHLPPDKKSILPDLLGPNCQMMVREAMDKEPIEAGVIYFAPPDYHLLVEPDGSFSLSCDPPQLFSRPSIDILFESAADAYGEGLIGVILSGANDDGALGLKSVVSQGGLGLVQFPGEASVPTMPLAAIRECPSAEILSAKKIGSILKEKCGYE